MKNQKPFNAPDAPLPVGKRHQHRSSPVVGVLLCTYNGEQYISQQIDSIVDQSHQNWKIYISDDGSTDSTLQILEGYQQKIGQERLQVFQGPKAGFAKNFLSMINRDEIEADYFAFSDQDDIWLKDKLERSLNFFSDASADGPTLYCSRTILFGKNNSKKETSPLFKAPPSFKNALVQSLAGGNTMLINGIGRELLKGVSSKFEIVSHDWITYLIISGCGGQVIYDPEPTVLYRQHENNLIGGNMSLQDRINRLRKVLGGSFIEWNDNNLLIINSLKVTLTDQNKTTLECFELARKSSFLKRIALIIKSGVYRQTVAGNISLAIATVLNKL
ncbi:glycosyltransferase family 2 protein [Pseudomonas sp. 18058]|uniref:glycosyltransferase family 2 protein n=1 Tax=Pseudomonas sp. 18058 TaxID=2681406 RepID=UPI0021140411|nr:glycosyltransferase family 2 protein [Pseudomonas sp. 18058]